MNCAGCCPPRFSFALKSAPEVRARQRDHDQAQRIPPGSEIPILVVRCSREQNGQHRCHRPQNQSMPQGPVGSASRRGPTRRYAFESPVEGSQQPEAARHGSSRSRENSRRAHSPVGRGMQRGHHNQACKDGAKALAHWIISSASREPARPSRISRSYGSSCCKRPQATARSRAFPTADTCAYCRVS
jgi:hypothetical protein